MTKCLVLNIYGRVQGVAFRYSTLDKAKELGIKGFVKNEPDGTVYAEAEGDDTSLKTFVRWCCRGPASACVDKVDVKEGPVKGYYDFRIK
ncbi:MAG: acylphosphatase [Deltaproteobacteria bacterium]|nr:acylphosphatase [Deltaproteobacteria bacterium]